MPAASSTRRRGAPTCAHRDALSDLDECDLLRRLLIVLLGGQLDEFVDEVGELAAQFGQPIINAPSSAMSQL